MNMLDEPIENMLAAHEARVLACLMEKQMTTPDYYPLTLKALTTACNQKSSRVPVMSLSDAEVASVINALRGRGLVTARMDGRADRFEQHLSRKLGITSKEKAVLCVLMLRGTLTLNEIRINTGRMVSFEDNEELQALLDALIQADEAMITLLPRASGQREARYAHVLCGQPDVSQITKSPAIATNTEHDRISALEKDVAELKQQLAALQKSITAS